MTDIVERLRQHNESYTRGYPILIEAADEIERLRDALEAAYEYIDHATGALPIIRAVLAQKEGDQWPLRGSPGLYDPIRVHE